VGEGAKERKREGGRRRYKLNHDNKIENRILDGK